MDARFGPGKYEVGFNGIAGYEDCGHKAFRLSTAIFIVWQNSIVEKRRGLSRCGGSSRKLYFFRGRICQYLESPSKRTSILVS